MSDLAPNSPKRQKRSKTHKGQNGHSLTAEQADLSALCGCNKCTVSSFLKTGCPKPSSVLLEALPNLDMDGLSDSRRIIRAGKLYLEHQQLCGAFTSIQSSIWKSLADRRVPFESVSRMLQGLRAFQPPHAHTPLLTHQPSTIKDVVHIFSLITSFFNHSLLEVLVSKLGSDRDKTDWEQYKSQFNEYSKRNVLECPSYHGSEAQPDSCELILKVDDSFTKLTIAQLFMFVDWLSAILTVSRHSVKLTKLSKKESCHVEMVYPQLSKEVELLCYLSTVVKEEVFPVSPEREEMLRSAGVLEIHCGEVHQVLTGVPQSSTVSLSGEHPNTEYFNNLTMAQAAMLLNPPHTAHDQTKNGLPHDAMLRPPGYGEGYLAPSSNIVYSQSDLASQFLTSRSDGPGTSSRDEQPSADGVGSEVSESDEDPDKPKPKPAPGKKTRGRVKIPMKYIKNKLRRYTTFSKRKSNIMKKAYELSTLTGTQVMLMVASETGHVYTFATPKLQPMITSEAGKALIQTCLHQPDPQPAVTTPTSVAPEQFDVRMSSAGYEEVDLGAAYKQLGGGTEEGKVSLGLFTVGNPNVHVLTWDPNFHSLPIETHSDVSLQRDKAVPTSLLGPTFQPDLSALMPVLSSLRPQAPLASPDYLINKERNRKT